MTLDVPEPRVLRELAGMLREVTGEGDGWADRITAATSLEDDLWLESVELAALGDAVRRRYGEAVDLTGYLAGLDPDALIALTVGDLAAFVTRRAPGAGEPG